MSPQTGMMILVTLVMGWFAAGSIWNVRKGKAVLRWMQGGLPLLGERTTVRWLGTTSVEMVIAKAKKPFEQATVVIFLEPRDVPWIWGPSRARGRRDTLIVRVRLARTPTADLEAIDVGSWSGREARPRITGERWELREPQGAEPLPLFYKLERAPALADECLALLRKEGLTVRRLSIRRNEPHLQVHVDLPSAATGAAEVFEVVKGIGERAVRI